MTVVVGLDSMFGGLCVEVLLSAFAVSWDGEPNQPLLCLGRLEETDKTDLEMIVVKFEVEVSGHAVVAAVVSLLAGWLFSYVFDKLTVKSTVVS